MTRFTIEIKKANMTKNAEMINLKRIIERTDTKIKKNPKLKHMSFMKTRIKRIIKIKTITKIIIS